ncbi:cytochrome b/b6 domain-containing protein [Novosphingobium sp.]|uniref:cytochrome b n=1 Tax=Novosphingobium sp. TaxID=1874826 RepID=UPI0025D71BE0|nr:cytochrome b/b6 domain-containing protein [Novosphingobium sp.]
MRTPGARYDARTIALHWISAALIVLMWCGAHVIDWFPRGPLRVDARSVHIVTGCLLLAIIGYRLIWRITGGVTISTSRGTLDLVAKAGHRLLYAMVMAVLVLGLFNAWVRGDDLFGLGHIPQYGNLDSPSRHLLANRIVGWHRLASNALLIVAGGHALVALYHRLVLRDAVLSRMLP